MDISISNQSIIVMVVFALLCTIVPIYLIYHFKKRYEVKISTFFIGVLTYILFGMLFIQVPDILIRGSVKPFSALISDSPITAAIYFSLLAVLVEEAGRFITFKYFMKSRMDTPGALMLGVGHGGIQAMFTGTSVMMSNAILAFAINSMGAEEYLAKLNLSEDALETSKKGLLEFSQISTSQHFFDASVPLILLALQIALSYFMFLCLKNEYTKLAYPITALIHFIILLPLYLARKGITNQLVVVETIMLILTLAVIYLVINVSKRFEKKA